MLNDVLANVQLGIDHVLSVKAYDHMLFLIALVVPFLFKDWKRVLFLVTVFVLGHSVSLAFATYDVVSVSNKWVAFLIPATILIIALFNVFTEGKKAQSEKLGITFFMTLFFGLTHGFGYVNSFESTVKNSDNIILYLLEISLGFEIGQLIVAFVILFLGFLCQTLFRFSKRDWVVVISAIVVGLILPMLFKNPIFA